MDYEEFEMGTKCATSVSRRRYSLSGDGKGDDDGAGGIGKPLNENEEEMKNVTT
jgi:hypothetical protein